MADCHPFTKLLPEQSLILYRRALRLTVNTHRAEDLVQATLLKAWLHRESFEPGTNLRAWLFTIMRNTFLSELRKYRYEVEDSDGILASNVAEEASQDHALALKELIAAIAHLPITQRKPLLMMGYFGYSQMEAAEACGCTLGTVKSRVSRGRAILSRLQEPDEVEACKDLGAVSDRLRPPSARRGVARLANGVARFTAPATQDRAGQRAFSLSGQI
ncbi:MAG: sigma-70 family RNA polymerase sigma factor [Paracoccaceae bacterium]